MKKSLYILFFTCMTYLGIAIAQNTSSTPCIVFQPDNRTTILSTEEVNTIWQTLEKLAGMSTQVMSRQAFLDFATGNSLLPTGSNIREEQDVRQKVIDNASGSTLLFTRITRWGNHFNVSMEKVTLPSFQMTRATLPLSAKVNTLEQLLDKLPGLMNQLGIAGKTLSKTEKQLALILPKETSKPLKTFYEALRKHLLEAGANPVIQSEIDENNNLIKISADFDTFESKSQMLDLPMQNRKIVKISINLEGTLLMQSGDVKTTFSFSKSDNRTIGAEDNNQKTNEEAFIDDVARDTVDNIIQKLNQN